jgi:hypothetical protein
MTLRRMRSYTSETGYVYQYYFVGKRPALPDAPEERATEYVFDVTSDRRTMFAVSIFVQDAALEAWAAANGRQLSESEQYASAKLRLLRAFDETAELGSRAERFVVDPENIEEVLEALDL